MEIFQTIWTALTTPNDGVMSIIFNDFGIPFIFIEFTVNVLLFTTILDIKMSKKQFWTYLLMAFITSCIPNLIFEKPFSAYINMIIGIILIKYIFKINWFKSIFAELFPMIISSIIEISLVSILLSQINITYEQITTIPLLRILCALFIYVIILGIYFIIKKYKHHTNQFDKISKHNQVILFFNSFVGIITIGVQFYLSCYYTDIIPVNISFFSVLTLVSYFFISIFSLLKTEKLETTSQNLEQVQIYNDTLKLLYDNIRTFRHDFGNIVQSIGGYVETEDIKGLKNYYKELQSDFENVKSLEILNPSSIGNPAIYSLLTSKYQKAVELGITMTIHVNSDFQNLNMKIYEFAKILGILLDNAIEACEKCEEKQINLEIRKDVKIPRQLLLIQNTYSNKNLDLDRIKEKGYTSKSDDGKPHGIGLWEVDKILKKSKNLNLFTTKDSIFFTQQFEIYEN